MSTTSEVLALKYRPTSFEELIGQESVSQTLSLAIDSNRISHAYLFSGLRGSGKTSTARIFSKALICENGPTSKPCGVCDNCVMARESRHMDIIEMDAASNRGIDDIRALIEQTKYKPAMARYKIFIIDEVHMLTPPAFNALLKTLEEPPEYVKFILATTDPLKLPATILSRTQHFRFKRIATTSVAHHLAYILNEENIAYESAALEILARSGNGSLRDSLTLLDQAIIYSKRHVDVATVTEMLGLVDPKMISDLFDAIFAKDNALLVTFVQKLEAYESQMVVDEIITYLKERMYVQDALLSTLVLERFFRILSDAKQLFAINADGSFVLSLIFFKMVEALKIQEIDTMIESLEKDMPTPSKTQNFSPQTTPPLETQKAQTPVPEKQAVPSRDEDGFVLYEKLVAQIMDRNANIGECFTKYIRFVSFENGVLTWESCVDEACKKALRHGFGVIKQLVREIFGFETAIKHIPCSDEPKQTQQPSQPEEKIPQPKEPVATPQSGEPVEPASMIEENEVSSGSCVTGCSDEQTHREFNGDDILEEPIVKKSIELFEVTKVTIQSKI